MKSKNNNIFCDVDETLVRELSHGEIPDIEINFQNTILRKKINHSLVNELKNKSSSVFIVVWTSNSLGVEYAESVVKSLGLTDFVDIVLFKPTKIIDDSSIFDWYLNQEKPDDF